MILEKLLINQFGPFSSPTTLNLSPEVTVLTGANDSGKSSILRLIEILFDNRSNAKKRDYNITRLAKTFDSWDRDEQWYCDVELKTPPDFQERLSSLNDIFREGLKNQYTNFEIPLISGDKVALRFYLAPHVYKPNVSVSRYEVIGVNGSPVDSPQLKALSDHKLDFLLPKIVYLPQDYESFLSKNNGLFTNLTKDLLKIGFEGKTFPWDDIKLNDLSREDLRSAAEHLNERVQGLFSYSIHVKFRFEFSEEEERHTNKNVSSVSKTTSMASQIRKFFTPSIKEVNIATSKKIDLYIEDQLRNETHVSYRGSGVIKIAYLASMLLNWNLAYQQNIILLDEPENSLHADSQHMLRAALEALAQNPNIQIIYSTHSPSMINPLRAESVRLFKRETRNNQVTSTIDNFPFDSNFLSVRNSLGLSPADSLLYAPITIITEGSTEVLCIPFLLKRLEQRNVPGFENIDNLLSLTHFLNGEGSAYEFFCRLAKSQGNKVIIFVDGDKEREVKKLNIEKKHPDVPIIVLNKGIEFEELVSNQTYFQGLAEITGENISLKEFSEWQMKTSLPKQQMFSKRVDRWMREVFDHSYSKPEVMLKAIEIADISEINLEPFKKLLQLIKAASEDLFN